METSIIELQKDLLNKYKAYVTASDVVEEKYKWKAISYFRTHWNLDAEDLPGMILEAFKMQENLFYPNALTTIKIYAQHFPAEVKHLFRELYSENALAIEEKIGKFQKGLTDLLPELRRKIGKEKFHHLQDERTIACYLTFRYPDKYYFYMDKYYQGYCDYLGIKPKESGHKYIHYLELAEDFKKNILIPEKEVIALHKAIREGNKDWDETNLIVQNVFFRLLPIETIKPTVLLVNITWNSKDWKAPSDDKSNHKYVASGGQPQESWNFDFDNSRNSFDKIYGFAQFTNPPNVSGSENLLIFYSKKQIVGFYGKAEILPEYLKFNDAETYNLIGHKPLCVVLPNKISDVREKGFLESKKRVGQTGFTYLSKVATVNNILDEAAKLNPDLEHKIAEIKAWVNNEHIEKPVVNMESNSLNQILYGPPGTGKTFNTINKAVEIANLGFLNEEKERVLIRKEFERLVDEEVISLITFHQSMSYEDFIEGIKPLKPDPENKTVQYDIQDGLFKKICRKAESNFELSRVENQGKLNFEKAFEKLQDEWEEDSEMKFPLKTEGHDFVITGFTDSSIQFRKSSGGTGHTLSINTLRDFYYKKREVRPKGVGIYYPSVLKKLQQFSLQLNEKEFVKNHVLIIDEINRGNVSQIFGELITLIEEDKRQGMPEALETFLPYSKIKFSVPPNLYIIGTMNTADRSIEALDTALRRRFTFVEMAPKPEIIREHGKSKGEIEGIDLVQLMKTMNLRIEKLLDKDHQIGHSYFLDVEDPAGLRLAFKNKIIPLLMEYFYGDMGKIGLILGSGFVSLKQESDFDFAEFNVFDNDIVSDLKERKVFEISDSESWSVDIFKKIYQK